MGYHDHKEASPVVVSAGVLVISDSRTEYSDESGKLICRLLESNGHDLGGFELLKNEPLSITASVNKLIESAHVQAIIISGGTGLSARDVTVETVAPMLDKKLDGFGELFRSLSYREIGSGCIMSRAMAGVCRKKVIICLPGSLKAVRLAMENIILPELGHMVREATR
ncbi:MAG: molybdenum cofactor biosynthesis protein MoaB [Dehalococcoidaceae bacterium]|nr:molybdenum cofactor biosynthesis protein MoaB [Dehalococcoidaceae bacterium]